MKEDGGEESSTLKNTAFSVETSLFSTVNLKFVKEPVTLCIAIDT